MKQPPPRDKWLSREGSAILLDACPPHVCLFVPLALSTGARKEAIGRLTWDRVDLENGIIDFGTGHGNKRRTVVPIGGKALDELKDAFEVRTTGHVLEWGGRPAGNVKIAFGKACKRAGLVEDSGKVGKDGKPIMHPWVTPHVLRHTAPPCPEQSGPAPR